jgi:glycosyltransferase involved in cell wall biosynthesis
VVLLAAPGGAPNARNTGVREARAPWTALLDDDDEWYPHKLSVQLDAAAKAAVATPVVTCRLVNRTPRAEFVLPRRLPDPDEPVSEYLTVRRGPFHGEGFIQTSTILAPTELLRRVPFTVGLRRFQELDWALRALDHADVGLVVADEPLVVWHADENRPRISFDPGWEDAVAWLERARPLLTRRGYSALATSVVSSAAAGSRSPRVAATLLRDARRHGDPRAIDYLTFLQIWLVPPQLRRTVRDKVLGRRRTAAEPVSA